MSNITINKGYKHNPNSSYAIVIAEFNHFITDSLLAGAIDTLKYSGGVSEQNVVVYKVPGAFEIPVVAKKLALSGKYAAVIALGAVIRGATPHFEYVCGPMASALMSVSVDTLTPVINGVLTTNTIEEAIERAGTKAGNKGGEAAQVALEMTSLMSQI